MRGMAPLEGGGAASRPAGQGPARGPVRPGRGSGLRPTEAGTHNWLVVYLVRAPPDVPGIAPLGPDPLAPGFTTDVLGRTC